MMNSYTEISPSGRGLHILVKGDIPADGRRKGFLEVYKAKRTVREKDLLTFL
jgi:putative DNA primase/helicase